MNQHKAQKEFLDLYEKEALAVFKFCHYRVSNKDLAEDLTQETFTKYWDALISKRIILNKRAFLFSIARNLVIDWYRRKKAGSLEVLLEENNAEIDVVPEDETANGQLERADARYLLGKIDELDSDSRNALHLRYREGLSPGEIGKKLHLSANTVSVRILRAVEKLRKLCGYEKRPTKEN